MLTRVFLQNRNIQNKLFFRFSDGQQKSTGKHSFHLPHPIYTKEELINVQIKHQGVSNNSDRVALFFVNAIRQGFDYMSGYKSLNPFKKNHIVSENIWVNRIIFLETVAAVPGFVAGMHRHLACLRMLRRDHGWIHTLLEEAENERIHLMTFLEIKKPNKLFQFGVILAQFYYVGLFSVMYMFFPRVCHRIVGYLEEQAVHTYTKMVDEINKESSPISHWKNVPASKSSIEYWKLDSDAKLLDVVLAIRMDEAHHCKVNHRFADDSTQQMDNPFRPGE